jgi:hypothetical protein
MTFVAFFVFLIVAFVAGGFWAVQHVRRTYSSDKPVAIPEFDASRSSDAAADANSPATAQSTPALESEGTPSAPAASPAPGVRTLTGSAQQRWDEFQRAARRGEKVRVELTANDINALLSADAGTRGKAFVRIDNNVGRVTVSIPLDGLALMGGRYLNGEATVRSSPDGDPAGAQISNVTVGNESMPDDFLDRRIFGWSTLRGYITDWVDEENVASFRIENNRVIGETR